MKSLHHFWTAIWPNLASNVAWVPLVGAYHWWTRRRFDALHDTIRELHIHLNGQGQHRNHSTELSMNAVVNWRKVFKSPQAFVSLLVAAVTTAGTAGLIDTNLSGAIQTLLVAILGVVSAVTHVAGTAKIAQRQALKAGDRE
jgi:hypothetical protein